MRADLLLAQVRPAIDPPLDGPIRLLPRVCSPLAPLLLTLLTFLARSGIPTFLRWRNLSSTDYTPFYDLSSPVFADFELYIRTLLNHTSPYTNVCPSLLSPDLSRLTSTQLTLAQDPTILAFELGNELGGYFAIHYPPPVDWSTAVAGLVKSLAPRTLVVSGRYGVSEGEARVEEIDILCVALSLSLIIEACYHHRALRPPTTPSPSY